MSSRIFYYKGLELHMFGHWSSVPWMSPSTVRVAVIELKLITLSVSVRLWKTMLYDSSHGPEPWTTQSPLLTGLILDLLHDLGSYIVIRVLLNRRTKHLRNQQVTQLFTGGVMAVDWRSIDVEDTCNLQQQYTWRPVGWRHIMLMIHYYYYYYLYSYKNVQSHK